MSKVSCDHRKETFNVNDSKIIIYAGGRQSGKTMRLVDLALKTGGYIIVPKYNDSLNPAYKELDDLGRVLPLDMAFAELRCIPRDIPIYMDEPFRCLEHLLVRGLSGFTLDLENSELS